MLIDGKPMSFWLYPPYPWRGATRKRTYGVMDIDSQSGTPVILSETGDVAILPSEQGALYAALKIYLLGGHRTVYTRSLNFGARNAFLLNQAAADKQATVLYSPRRGVLGFCLQAGKRRAALLGQAVWYRNEADNYVWLRTLRRLANTLQCGDYDTAGSLGQATLTRHWHAAALGYEWRLPHGLSQALGRYTIGGRAEAPGSIGGTYPQAYELDLSSAYPTAVARGLPVGQFTYHNAAHEPDSHTRPALFGRWRIRVHSLIEWSPVPVRDWDRADSPLTWMLEPGEYEYCGWREEVMPLRASGLASVDFLEGVSWAVLSTLLAPWVDRLGGLRADAERAGDLSLAEMIKAVTNAAIGRWGMDKAQYRIVPDSEHDLALGDIPVEIQCSMLGVGEKYSQLSGVWARVVSEEARHAMPEHWASYVRMAVRMELWRRTTAERQAGAHIILTNFDSVWMVGEPQATDSLAVGAVQDAHPWIWKVKQRADVLVPYNRGVIYLALDTGQVCLLPGLSSKAREAMVHAYTLTRRRDTALRAGVDAERELLEQEQTGYALAP